MSSGGAQGKGDLLGGWLRPDVSVLVAAGVWGTIWIPLRQLGAGGWDSGAAAAASCVLAVAAMTPFVARRWRAVLVVSPQVWLVGFLFGFGLALYWEGLIRGNVARVTLLFYMMPVWTAVLARFLNGEAITRRRVIGIVLGVAGMLVVFSRNGWLPVPSGIGDFMGLLSGLAWSIGIVLCARPGMEKTTLSQVFISLAIMAPGIYVLSILPGSRDSMVAFDAGSGLAMMLFLLAALGLIWLLAGMMMTLYGAERLSPGKVAIFLMVEVVIAIVTSAALIDEPFGAREIAGATLILGASLVEFVGADKRS